MCFSIFLVFFFLRVEEVLEYVFRMWGESILLVEMGKRILGVLEFFGFSGVVKFFGY